MSDYTRLKSRLDEGDVIILDGAIGTQLQTMGVPMNNVAWAGAALETHPTTIRLMHERYIDAGVDIITVNSYASARHNLEPLGLGDRTAELNWRAVTLARDARDARAHDRPVLVAGSVSNFGLLTGGEDKHVLHRYSAPRTAHTEAQSKAYLREQAELLVEGGVDFLIAESTGNNTHRRWIQQACLATGAPTWIGFKTHLSPTVPEPRVGYASDELFESQFAELMGDGGDVAAVFHTSLDATDKSLDVVDRHWHGPVAVYPEAERHDYTRTQKEALDTPVTPTDFCERAERWVERGVQIIGGCCGIEIEHIKPLRERLPEKIPKAS